MHIYRWDLDKTYLDTDIGSKRGLIRAAFERADQKRTLPGARTLMQGITRHDPEARIFVLSGSPTQMRRVLAAKLEMDGIAVSRFILKDNLRNLRRGRLRAVKDQLGYKLPHLLEARADLTQPATESLFGDDSEVDALIYTAFAAVVDGSLDIDGLTRLLKAGRAYPDAIARAVDAAARIDTQDAVEDIFIHVGRGMPLRRLGLLGAPVKPVFSWMQAAWVLAERGRITKADAVAVVDECRESRDLTDVRVAALAQDAVHRNLISSAALLGLLAEDSSLSAVMRTLDRLGDNRRPLPSGGPSLLRFLREH